MLKIFYLFLLTSPLWCCRIKAADVILVGSSQYLMIQVRSDLQPRVGWRNLVFSSIAEIENAVIPRIALLQKRELHVAIEPFVLTIDPQCPSMGFSSGVTEFCVTPNIFESVIGVSTMSHEILHLFHNRLRTSVPIEEDWVREGLAQFFAHSVLAVTGTAAYDARVSFLTPLMGDYDIEKINLEQYGHNFWYIYYLYTHCGGDEVFQRILHGVDGLIGEKAIDAILRHLNSPKIECSDFIASATSFEVARVHNRIQEVGSQKDSRFFLTDTQITPKNYYQSLELGKQFSPILLDPRDDHPKLSKKGIKRFWIHSRHPYEVVESMPDFKRASPENWRQVVIKSLF